MEPANPSTELLEISPPLPSRTEVPAPSPPPPTTTTPTAQKKEEAAAAPPPAKPKRKLSESQLEALKRGREKKAAQRREEAAAAAAPSSGRESHAKKLRHATGSSTKETKNEETHLPVVPPPIPIRAPKPSLPIPRTPFPRDGCCPSSATPATEASGEYGTPDPSAAGAAEPSSSSTPLPKPPPITHQTGMGTGLKPTSHPESDGSADTSSSPEALVPTRQRASRRPTDALLAAIANGYEISFRLPGGGAGVAEPDAVPSSSSTGGGAAKSRRGGGGRSANSHRGRAAESGSEAPLPPHGAGSNYAIPPPHPPIYTGSNAAAALNSYFPTPQSTASFFRPTPPAPPAHRPPPPAPAPPARFDPKKFVAPANNGTAAAAAFIARPAAHPFYADRPKLRAR